MAQNWFVVRGKNEEGPFTGTQLKDMAAKGQLKPTDRVRREDMTAPVLASSIKGLFAKPEAAVPSTSARSDDPPTPPTDSTKASNKKKVMLFAVIGGACLLLCCGGLSILGSIFMKERGAAEKEVASAEKLWSEGKKGEAIAKYKAILENKSQRSALKEEQRALVYGRVIDFEFESGNPDAANQLLAEAAKDRVTPIVSHAEAKTAIAAKQPDRPQQPQQGGFVWKQPKGWWGEALKSSDLRFQTMPDDKCLELVKVLHERDPVKIAKAFQHFDPHSFFTEKELLVMQNPVYGQIWGPSDEVSYPNSQQRREVAIMTPSGEIKKYADSIFFVTGKPFDSPTKIESGTFYRTQELKDGTRVRFPQKTVSVMLEYSYSGKSLEKRTLKAVRLHSIKLTIPASYAVEKRWGWDYHLSEIFQNRVGGIQCIDNQTDPELFTLPPEQRDRTQAARATDVFRIRYEPQEDPARPYVIQTFAPEKTIRGQ